MSAYGWMPFRACTRCGGRWPTRYQYTIIVQGPDGQLAVDFCAPCFGIVFEKGVRPFNIAYTGSAAAKPRARVPEPGEL